MRLADPRGADAPGSADCATSLLLAKAIVRHGSQLSNSHARSVAQAIT
jgi:hypothetical protein